MDEKRITQIFLYYREKFGEIDKKISDLHKEKKKLNKDFLSKLPFQPGDKVRNRNSKNSNCFFIGSLKSAKLVFDVDGRHLYVNYTARPMLNNGMPSSVEVPTVNNYFDLTKEE